VWEIDFHGGHNDASGCPPEQPYIENYLSEHPFLYIEYRYYNKTIFYYQKG
jgi:hypothetical protein